MNAFAPIAARLDNATRRLISSLQKLGGLDEEAAGFAAAYFLRHKVVRLDPSTGQFTVRHGAFLDREPIRRAAGMGIAIALQTVAADIAHERRKARDAGRDQ